MNDAMKEKIFKARSRYDEQVDKLLEEVSMQREESLNRQPGNGWSALQTIHHLILVEANSLAYVQKKLSYHPALARAGAGGHWRSFLLWAGLNIPLKFKAPRSVGDEQLPKTSSLSEIRENWQRTRDAWQDFLDQLPYEQADKAVYRHPRAGRLSWIQMFDFFRYHLQRHRLQIRRAIRFSQS